MLNNRSFVGASRRGRRTPPPTSHIPSHALQEARETGKRGGERRGSRAHQAFSQRGIKDAKLLCRGTQRRAITLRTRARFLTVFLKLSEPDQKIGVKLGLGYEEKTKSASTESWLRCNRCVWLFCRRLSFFRPPIASLSSINPNGAAATSPSDGRNNLPLRSSKLCFSGAPQANSCALASV